MAITSSGALALCYVDQEAVAIALPSIQRDLGGTGMQLQLIVNAYLVTLAACIALAGRTGDVFGCRRVFRLGIVTFLAGSTACGLSPTVTAIVIGRLVQGVGAAMMVPNATAAVIAAFAPSTRGRALSVSTGVAMVFLALGPSFGGLLTSLISWRAVFLINLPLGSALLAVMAVALPPQRRPPAKASAHRLDWVGQPLLVSSLGALILGVMQIREWGWRSPGVIALCVGGAVFLAVTVVWERRHPDPLIDLSILARSRFAIELTAVSAIRFAVVGFSLFSAIWIQDILGFDPIEAGLSQLPFLLTLLVVTPLSGLLYDRIGAERPLVAGMTAIGVSLLWMAMALHHYSYPRLVVPYVLLGAGLGLAVSPAITDLLEAAPEDRRGRASGLVQTLREFGAALGIAVMGAVVANVQIERIRQLARSGVLPAGRDLGRLERGIGAAVAAPGRAAAKGFPVKQLPEIKGAVTYAVARSYVLAGVVTLLAALLALRPLLAASAVRRRTKGRGGRGSQGEGTP